VTDFSPESLKALSEILASENTEVFDLCARIGFWANSLEPLQKLQRHRFTPEAISDLHTECGEDINRMIEAIEALE
jgi:hypothetical protein